MQFPPLIGVKALCHPTGGVATCSQIGSGVPCNGQRPFLRGRVPGDWTPTPLSQETFIGRLPPVNHQSLGYSAHHWRRHTLCSSNGPRAHANVTGANSPQSLLPANVQPHGRKPSTAPSFLITCQHERAQKRSETFRK